MDGPIHGKTAEAWNNALASAAAVDDDGESYTTTRLKL